MPRIFDSFPKSFTTAVFKSKYGHEVMKTLNIEATALGYYGNSTLARGKTYIAEFNYIKVVGQKSDAVINTDFFLNVF